MPDMLGYARVSTAGQDLEAQRRRLKAKGGALRLFEDIGSGQSFDRPGLVGCWIKPVRATRCGLDRLGRSLGELLGDRGGFQDPRPCVPFVGGALRHWFGRGRTRVPRVRCHRASRAPAHRRAHPRRPWPALRAESRGRRPLRPEKLQAASTLVRGDSSPSKAARAKLDSAGQRLTVSSPSRRTPRGRPLSVHRCRNSHTSPNGPHNDS
jgi:hypothetical protein